VYDVQRALRDAVAEGRLDGARLEEAAARVRRLAETRPAAPAHPHPGEPGLEAARRALLVEGDVALDGRPTGQEMSPDPSIAAGPSRRYLGDVLDEHLPEDAPRASRRLYTLRDAHRHAWQRETVEANPGAIVVETGVPAWRPTNCSGYIATHGAGYVNFRAAAEVLTAKFTVS
jgi:beta-N-acetylhexosaminidase